MCASSCTTMYSTREGSSTVTRQLKRSVPSCAQLPHRRRWSRTRILGLQPWPIRGHQRSTLAGNISAARARYQPTHGRTPRAGAEPALGLPLTLECNDPVGSGRQPAAFLPWRTLLVQVETKPCPRARHSHCSSMGECPPTGIYRNRPPARNGASLSTGRDRETPTRPATT